VHKTDRQTMSDEVSSKDLDFVRIDENLVGRAISVLKALQMHGLKAISAESCTGGLVSTVLSEAPGAAEHFVAGIVQAGRLHFDDEANTTAFGTVGVGNSSSTATAILVLFLPCKLTRLRRRPAACNAACQEAPSGQYHGHGVLPYWKAADEDGSFVIHGGFQR
jgi:Competence-damaged protein